jgi:protein-disulfide isomerase
LGLNRALFVLAGLCAALAACAGDQPALDGVPGGISTEPLASAGAYPEGAGSGEVRDGASNPLLLPDATTPGGRAIIENPTVSDVMMAGPLPEMSLGRPDAPVTIVQYASLTCPHCRRFHLETFPELKRTYIDTGKVRYVLREFPIGQTSGNATIALRCAKPERYFDLYGRFLKEQASWVSQEVRLEAIFAVARQVGMTRAEFDACLKNQGMIDALKWVKERGRRLGVIGTPNFFIDGKLVKSVLSMADFRTLVEPRLTATGTAAAAVGAR